MKSIFSVIIALLISVASFAKPDFELSAFENHLILKTSDWSISGIDILIKDAAGQILLNQSYSNRGKSNSLKLNIANLPQGKYEIQISNWQKIQTQGFSKENNLVQLSKAIETFFKPQILVENKKAKINYFNQSQNADIKILDPQNQTIYTTKITDLQYGKTFNFNETQAGEYTIAIITPAREFWNTVVIK